MKLIIYSKSEPVSISGRRSFLGKYGLPDSFFQPPGPVMIQEDAGHDLDQPAVKGELECGDQRIPLFVRPGDCSLPGDALAFFSEDGREIPCITRTKDTILVGFDFFKHRGLMLSGVHEKTWGREWTKERCSFMKEPHLDKLDDLIFSLILEVFQEQHRILITKQFWPYGKPFAVCLTHDVDETRKTYQWLTNIPKLLKKQDFQGLVNQAKSLIKKMQGFEPYWTFETIMDMERDAGAVSSFYFLQEKSRIRIHDPKTWRHLGRRYDWCAPEIANLMTSMENRGWEVGLHGSFDSFKDCGMIHREKRELEEVLGKRVAGVRQHNLNLDIPGTWLCHEREKFLYDTTLGSNRCIGFRWGTCHAFEPFSHQENRVLSLLEIPLIIEEIPFFRSPEPWNDFLEIFEKVVQYQGVLTLLWHPAVLNVLEYPEWCGYYQKILEHCRTNKAWMTSGREIAIWWQQREAVSMGYEQDGSELVLTFSGTIPGGFGIRVWYPQKPEPGTGEKIYTSRISSRDILVKTNDKPHCEGILRIPMEPGLSKNA